jgi:hypothetical protein
MTEPAASLFPELFGALAGIIVAIVIIADRLGRR